MAEVAAVGHQALTKRVAVEYLERQGKATAKELGIDSDSRASTASELLERMAAQGLVTRDEKQRPREYVLTEAGRERLAFFRSQDNGERPVPPNNPGRAAEGGSASDPNPAAEDSGEPESEEFDAFREEIRSQFQGLREGMQHLVGALGIRRTPHEESPDLPTQVQELSARLKSLAEKTKQELDVQAIVNLYRARHELSSLRWPDDKRPVKDRIAHLEAQVGRETGEKVERLLELEQEIGEEALRAVLGLRQELNLPPNVVGVSEETASGSGSTADAETDAFGFAK